MKNETASGKDILAFAIVTIICICGYIYAVAEHMYGTN